MRINHKDTGRVLFNIADYKPGDLVEYDSKIYMMTDEDYFVSLANGEKVYDFDGLWLMPVSGRICWNGMCIGSPQSDLRDTVYQQLHPGNVIEVDGKLFYVLCDKDMRPLDKSGGVQKMDYFISVAYPTVADYIDTKQILVQDVPEGGVFIDDERLFYLRVKEAVLPTAAVSISGEWGQINRFHPYDRTFVEYLPNISFEVIH